MNEQTHQQFGFFSGLKPLKKAATTRMNHSNLLGTLLAIGTALFTAPTARANFHVWTGAVSGYWSNTNNWSGGNAPQLFEPAPLELIFPSGPTRTTVTNDIDYGYYYPLYVDSIAVTGDNYVIAGQGNGTNIALTGGAAPFFFENLQNLYCTGSNITFDSSLNLILMNTNTITNSATSTLDIQATLTGTGGWTFEGAGEMSLDGLYPNTCTGPSQILAGTVALGKTFYPGGFGFSVWYGYTAINGPLVIGPGQFGAPAQVVETNSGGSQFSGAPVTINAFGSLVLAGYSPEVITNLSLAGGQVTLADSTVEDGYGNFYENFGHLSVASLTNYESLYYGVSSAISGHGSGDGLPGLYDSLLTDANLALIAPGTNLPAIINLASGQLVLDTEIIIDPFQTALHTIIKNGYGTLILSGDNEYYASTLIEEGVVVASGSNCKPLGSFTYGSGATTNQAILYSGAQLIVDTDATFLVPVVLNGYGTDGTGEGALVVQHNGAFFQYGVVASSDSAVVVTNPTDTVAFGGYYAGALSGSANFHKKGPGTLTLNNYGGTNGLTGTAYVDEGALVLAILTNNPGGTTLVLNGPVVIGTNGAIAASSVVLQAPWQMIGSNSPITINDGGVLNLNWYPQTLSSLTLNGGTVENGNSLTIYGDVTAQAGSSQPQILSGYLNLGGTNRTITVANGSALTITAEIDDGGNNAGITKAGWGELDLHGATSYGGLTFVNSGRLSLFDKAGLESTAAGMTIANGAQLVLNDGVRIIGKPLSIGGTGLGGAGALIGEGTNSWTGPVTMTSNTVIYVYTNSQTELSGAISGAYGLTKTGDGVLLLDGNQANTYSGLTTVQQGLLALAKTNCAAVPGALVAGTGLGAADSALVQLLQPGQLNPSSGVLLNSDGLLDLASVTSSSAGSVSGSGELNLGLANFRVGLDNTTNTFSGSILGLSAALVKLGTGAWTLSGGSSYFGQTLVGSGTLLVDGYLGNSSLVVSNSATLGGVGTVGTLSALGGSRIVPGHGAGLLNSGSVTFSPASTLSVDITGTNAGTGYNELNVSGVVTVNNPTLQVSMSGKGATNAQYVIINDAANNPVTGTFAGLPEGATVMANNGVQFTISYHGGTGYEVVLTQTSLPPQPNFTGIKKLGGGAIQLNGTGAAGLTYTVQANDDLTTTNWINIGSAVAGQGGALSFIDPNAPNFSMRFYRFKAQ